MNPILTNKDINNLEEYHNVYSKIDLTFLDEDYSKIKYYLYKFQNYPYRTFCTLEKHISNVYNEGIDNLSAVIGYPFSETVTLSNDTLRKVKDIEIWFEHSRVRRNPEKLFKNLRKITLKAHAEGVRVRAVTELYKLPLDTINEWFDVCKEASVDHIQTGYGLTSLNENWLPEMKEKLSSDFTIKAVGNINSIQQANNMLKQGAQIIGSSTI